MRAGNDSQLPCKSYGRAAIKTGTEAIPTILLFTPWRDCAPNAVFLLEPVTYARQTARCAIRESREVRGAN